MEKGKLLMEVLNKSLCLSEDQQLELISKISARLLIRKHPKAKRKKWMEMAGLGSEIWKDVDAQRYVDRERESW